jgi:broad specificity phosphatase PhoE
VRADVLLASVLPRAIETASIIAPGLGLEISGQECDLCEVHTGEADGLTWTEYAARYGSFDMQVEPDRVFAPAGESWNSFHQRVQRMLERVAREYDGQTVVAVCHAGVIMASMRMLLGIPHLGSGAQLRPTNTGLTEWEHDPALDRWTLHSFNETSHLLGLRQLADRSADHDRAGSGVRPVGRSRRMSDRHEYSVEAARDAAEHDELGTWVKRFLASPGSDNAPLAHRLSEPPRWWLGPVQVPVDQLNRLAGPPDAPVLCPMDEDDWRDDVDDMAELIEDEWEPPPVIVSYREGQLLLEDGNHRVEGVRRAGKDHVWAVIAFGDPAERDRFVAPSSPEGANGSG